MTSKFAFSGFLANRALVAATVAVLLLAGCGKKEGDRPAGQVIAHIGSEDVTIQELENEFRLANVPADKRSDAMTKKALQEIVTRKAIARQAIMAKLDREPTIQLDLLREKEQMLARTFMQRKLSNLVAAVGQSELDQFITAHPTQFAKRVVFVTEQIEVPLQGTTPEVAAATKDAKTLAEVEQKLTELKVPFRKSSGALDSASLPEQMEQKLQGGAATDVFFVRSASGGAFFKIVDTKSKPLEGNEASNLARQMIAREKSAELSRQATTDAQKSATYEGDYAKVMRDDPPK